MEIFMEIGIICILLVLLALLLKINKRQKEAKMLEKEAGLKEQIDSLQADMEYHLKELRRELTETTQNAIRMSGEMTGNSITTNFMQMEARIKSFESGNEQKLENIRGTVKSSLEALRRDNNEKLDEMRRTVDEKLQKTLEDKMTQSFRLVNERLEQVYKGLGEMQTLAVGVGDLKKVLSNVKTRGILGEIQLGAILREILSPEQYEENVVTSPGTRNPVEFAVKLPVEGGESVYLPIDSKFPADAYQDLRDAYESGSSERVDSAAKALLSRMKSFAKDIRDKYIDPPYTTEFAILFLPFEGLYAEVVNRGMVEVLQREYHVNLAGPSTMAALLNSLQMGFRTFAIQKRSNEVWAVLGAVKNEFGKFEDVLRATQNRLEQAGNELDKLVGTRSRAISRKLREVERLDDAEAKQHLDFNGSFEEIEEI